MNRVIIHERTMCTVSPYGSSHQTSQKHRRITGFSSIAIPLESRFSADISECGQVAIQLL